MKQIIKRKIFKYHIIFYCVLNLKNINNLTENNFQVLKPPNSSELFIKNVNKNYYLPKKQKTNIQLILSGSHSFLFEICYAYQQTPVNMIDLPISNQC